MGLGPSYAEDPVFAPVAPALTRSLGPDRLSVDLRSIWGRIPVCASAFLRRDLGPGSQTELHSIPAARLHE